MISIRWLAPVARRLRASREPRMRQLARLMWRSIRARRARDERDLGYLDIGGESGGA